MSTSVPYYDYLGYFSSFRFIFTNQLFPAVTRVFVNFGYLLKYMQNPEQRKISIYLHYIWAATIKHFFTDIIFE